MCSKNRMPPGVSSSCRCSSAVVPELKKCSEPPDWFSVAIIP